MLSEQGKIDLINQISLDFNQTKDLDLLLEKILTNVRKLLNADEGSSYLTSGDFPVRQDRGRGGCLRRPDHPSILIRKPGTRTGSSRICTKPPKNTLTPRSWVPFFLFRYPESLCTPLSR